MRTYSRWLYVTPFLLRVSPSRVACRVTGGGTKGRTKQHSHLDVSHSIQGGRGLEIATTKDCFPVVEAIDGYVWSCSETWLVEVGARRGKKAGWNGMLCMSRRRHSHCLLVDQQARPGCPRFMPSRWMVLSRTLFLLEVMVVSLTEYPHMRLREFQHVLYCVLYCTIVLQYS